MLSKKKVMIIGSLNGKNTGKFGGAEKSMVYLANWLSKCEEVYLVSVEGDGSSYPIYDNVIYIQKEIKYGNRIKNQIQMKKNTIEVIEKYKPDVLVGFWIHPLFYAIKKSKKYGIKMFYTERNDPNLYYNFITKLMRKITLNSLSGLIFQTHDAMNYFNKKVRKKSCVIPNPIYFKNESNEVHFDNRIVTVGRLTEQKNQSLLINAFKKISIKYPSLILEIYGDGKLNNDLKELIRDLKLQEKVFLKGTTKNILQEITGARLFVLSSKYEGMPNALIEAMGLGIPSISSDCPCGGPKELIDNGKNGFLFKNNDIDDLIKKMDLLLEDDLLSKKISVESRKICVSNSPDNIFERWLNFIVR